MTKRTMKLLLRPAVILAIIALAAAPASAAPGKAGRRPPRPKLDRALEARANAGWGESRVIVELTPDAPAGLVRALGGIEGRRLRTFPGRVARINNHRLRALANSRWVKSVHLDRPVSGAMIRTGQVIGSADVRYSMGYDGAGVGVAIIDSGITSWHDDLMGGGLGGQKVVEFVDFVGGQYMPYDDNGHGTHVAGVVAGTGYDTYGKRAGVAPGAHLVGLKVLDANGAGHISDVIAAMDWVVAHHATYNIRVVNLSVGAAVTQSYQTDPLTLAAKRVVEAGVVLVAAAGNLGRDSQGETQYGAITAPGNAPWVLTVGASSHMGTKDRSDDTIAGYSSRGPTAVDYAAKPDLVAPGTGIVSLSDPNSLFYGTKSHLLVNGWRETAYMPYLSLSGTSMAAPVVSGAVALMLQANPALTPNAVKAILQYTAQEYPGYNALTQGAGFLDAYGAVRLAAFFRHARPGDIFPTGQTWSRHIIWGNHLLARGMIVPTANAWALNVVWGASRDAVGDNIVWGATCPADADCENVVWGAGAGDGENVVWGASCDASDPDCDNVVWGNSVDTDGDGFDDNVVWGNSVDNDGDGFDDNVVWGSSVVCDEADPECDNVVWGNGADEDENVVWGSDCGDADCDNVVWGSSTGCDGADPECDNVVWGSADDAENVVWGNSADDDNVVWGSSTGCDATEPDCDNVVWGSTSGDEDNVVWGNSVGDDENIMWEEDPPPADLDASSPPPASTGGTTTDEVPTTDTTSTSTGGGL